MTNWIYKIIGLILIIIGVFILKFFPDMSEYQRKGMTLSGILIAIFLILVGIGLLIFG